MKLNRCVAELLLVVTMLLGAGCATTEPMTSHLADNGAAKMAMVFEGDGKRGVHDV